MAVPEMGLAAARQAMLQVMTDSLTIHRIQSVTEDPGGGFTEPRAPHEVVAGRLVSRRVDPPEGTVGGRAQAVTVWEAYLPYGTDVLPGDTITKGEMQFEVGDDENPRLYAVATHVSLTLVRG